VKRIDGPRLIWIKQYREDRLRAKVRHVAAQLAVLERTLENMNVQRHQIVQKWRTLSRQTQQCRADGVRALRDQLNHYYCAHLKLQKEQDRLQAERITMQQDQAALEAKLKVCLVKQEKLRLMWARFG
jgi:chromosome segregation ATPase